MAQKPFVIIVDDDQNFLDLYGAKLIASGFEVQPVLGSAPGLAAIQARKPDIVLLDVMMPGMNGIEVLSKLKGDPNFIDLPVVLLTSLANTTPEGISIGGIDLKSTSKMTGVYFIKKDIDLGELVSKLKEILSKYGK